MSRAGRHLLAALLGVAVAGGCRSAAVVKPGSRPLPAAGAQGMIQPTRLQPGDTIMLVAPAGDVPEERMILAQRGLEELGYRVKMRKDVGDKEGYLAGPDQRRAKELMQAFLDPEVKAIFTGRGGYGTMRILDRLDYEQIRARPKILIGFSDITGLHLALNRQAGLVTFHTPTSQWRLATEKGMGPFTEEYFWKAIVADDGVARNGYAIEIPDDAPQPVVLRKGRARGRLAGGNLSTISALEGTPYAIDTRDAVLLIEDLREAPYRIDRMLRQLQLAGKLDDLRGAVLGQFTLNYDREEDQMTEDPRFTVDGVLKQYFKPLGIPVLMNYPVGHHRMNASLPLGAQVEVDADEGVLRILPYKR